MYQKIASGNSKTNEFIFLPNEIPLEDCNKSNKNNIQIKTIKLIDKDSTYTRLGFGGFGDVFLGMISDDSKQKVAVKVTNLNKKNRITFAKREARLLSRFNNKNIVNFFGYFRDDHNYYLVTEYCTHGSLRDIIRDEKRLSSLTEFNILGIIAEISEGLQYLHHLRLVHHDLKPENVMISEKNTCKIIDFGLSKLVPEEGLTHVAGTHKYFAPEMCGETPHFGCAIDCWAMGCIFYRLLYCKPPFDCPDKEELKKMIITKETPYRALSKQNFDMRTDYRYMYELLQSLMIKNPEYRYTASQILEILQGIQTATSPSPDIPSPHLEPFPRTRVMKLIGCLQSYYSFPPEEDENMSEPTALPDDELPYIRYFMPFSLNRQGVYYESNDEQCCFVSNRNGPKIVYLKKLHLFIMRRQRYHVIQENDKIIPDFCEKMFIILKQGVEYVRTHYELEYDPELIQNKYTNFDDVDFSKLCWVKKYYFLEKNHTKQFGALLQCSRIQIEFWHTIVELNYSKNRVYIFDANQWTVKIIDRTPDDVSWMTYSLQDYWKILDKVELANLKECLEIIVKLFQTPVSSQDQ